MAFRLTQPTAAAKNSILAPVSTLVGHGLSISSISYFLDGKQMISGSSDKSVRRWDLQEGKEIVEARDVCEQGVGAVAVSRDGRRFATADKSGKLKVRDVKTGTMKIIQGHSRRINCIDISADCTLLASGAEDSIAWIWSLDTCKLIAGPFKSADLVGALRFSQDSKKLAIKSDVARCLEVWNIQTQTLDVRVGKYHRKNGSAAPVFWTTTDRTIVAAFSFTYDSPVMIYEFDASTLETVGAPFKGHTDTIIGLALSSDCALLASASDDHTIKLWAFESRQLLASFHVMFSHHLIFSPDSRQLAYTTQYNTKIYLCNTPPDILQISALRNPPLSDIRHVCEPFLLSIPPY
jgi:WD40 repeat protein